MLESFNSKYEMQYQRLSAEEQTKRGILGRLVGVIADFKQPTRNGRRYTEELWDKLFSDPLMQEKLQNRCLLGELGHPEDRQEIDIEKVALCLAEQPKKGNDGKLHGVFDILDTPNGRILKTLCDYGCKIGVSSRGTGDVTEDFDGNETVDSDTFECECWDAVLLPAVKDARPTYVHESLNTKKTLKVALQEALENSSEDDKRVMEKTLNELDLNWDTETIFQESEERLANGSAEELSNILYDTIFKNTQFPQLNIDEIEDHGVDANKKLITFEYKGHKYELNISLLESQNPDKVNIDTNVTEEPNMAAEDNGAEMIQELQESLRRNQELENQIKSLQEQLSVCYTKEARYSTILGRTKTELSQSQEAYKKLEGQVQTLNTSIKDLKESKENDSKTIILLNKNIKTLKEQLNNSSNSRKSLNEDMTKKDSTIKELQGKVSALTENFNTECRKTKELESDKRQLSEQLEIAKKDSQIIKSQANAKITKSNQLVEKYKTVAKTAVDKYISSQATRLGVKVEEIKNRLSENYSFNDIDKVCESLQQYKLSINALPFTVSSGKQPKMKIVESKKESILPNDDRFDDDIDDSLKNFL